MESRLFMEGRCIVGCLERSTMLLYGITSKDMDGIVNQLLITKGVECSIFMYAASESEYKVSMRSKGRVNVAAIASTLGGGGHVRAAGVTMQGTSETIIGALLSLIQKQLGKR
jgi:phosphoesterase RecJ-like protein